MKAIVLALLDKGANINHSDCDGMTALMYAARNDHSAIARALIEQGASVNAKNNVCFTNNLFIDDL
jgi:ankyrin repeat protein